MTHAEDGKRAEGGSGDDDLPDDLAGPARRALEQIGEVLHARGPSFADPGRSGRIPSSPGRSRTGRTS